MGIVGVGFGNIKKSKPINIINPNSFKEYVNKIDYNDKDKIDYKDNNNINEDDLLFEFDDI